MNNKTETLIKKEYILPDTKNKVFLHGSPEFIQDISEMLDIMVHSPTSLKLLNFNANLSKHLVIEEFKEALDLGRNTGESIQLTHKQLKNGEPVSKYRWLTLLPHELRHSYNASINNSLILQALAYAVVNEADAQAIEGLVAMELNEYIKKGTKKLPDTDTIQSYLATDKKLQVFKSFYDNSKGNDTERKAQAMIMFVKEFAKHPIKGKKTTLAELSYKTAIERDTTANGWKKCSDEVLKKIENCLLGKIPFETVANESWMKGRIPLINESANIKKEWPTFCKRIMDGTFNTDVILYGQNIHPSNLIESLSPQLAQHLRQIGIIPSTAQYIQKNSGR